MRGQDKSDRAQRPIIANTKASELPYKLALIDTAETTPFIASIGNLNS
jgi:hypothetical protein